MVENTKVHAHKYLYRPDLICVIQPPAACQDVEWALISIWRVVDKEMISKPGKTTLASSQKSLLLSQPLTHIHTITFTLCTALLEAKQLPNMYFKKVYVLTATSAFAHCQDTPLAKQPNSSRGYKKHGSACCRPAHRKVTVGCLLIAHQCVCM